MAIRIDSLSVVVPIKKINRAFPGGFASFCRKYLSPHSTGIWHDRYLLVLCKGNSLDPDLTLHFWKTLGLHHTRSTPRGLRWHDLCVIEPEPIRSTHNCDWIEIDARDRCVWLKGTDRGDIVAWRGFREYREVCDDLGVPLFADRRHGA